MLIRSRIGFTLIELLVVIAIIAILAAIIFPIFTSAKATAQTTKCLSSIKQVGIAMSLYADSNGGGLPNYSIGNGSQRLMWSYFIKPYMRADRIYRCPSLPSYEDKTQSYDAMRTARVFGYGVPYPHLFDPYKPATKLSAIPRQSKIMLMCGSYSLGFNMGTRSWVESGYPVVYCRACADRNDADARPDGNVAGRHGGRSDVEPYGKSVVIFCDLHVKAMDKERVIHRYSSVTESGNCDMWAHFDNIDH